MDGPVHRGLEKGSIVHLSLQLPCPSMICAWVTKATSGQKTCLSPSHMSLCVCVCAFSLHDFPPFHLLLYIPITYSDIHSLKQKNLNVMSVLFCFLV